MESSRRSFLQQSAMVLGTVAVGAFKGRGSAPAAWAQDNHAHTKGYAVFSKDGRFTPYEFERHAVGDNDVLIEILYSGICHSDLHHAWEEWRKETYPMVPGHEIGSIVPGEFSLTLRSITSITTHSPKAAMQTISLFRRSLP